MRLWSEILQVEDILFQKIFNHYRPELHYMRGAGPKWIEKHSAVAECAMPQELDARPADRIGSPMTLLSWGK